jgi:hypothetical protein
MQFDADKYFAAGGLASLSKADGGPVLSPRNLAAQLQGPEEQGAQSPSFEGVGEGLQAVGRGAMPLARTVGEYVASRAAEPNKIPSDIGKAGSALAEGFAEDPIGTIAGAMPGIGNVMAAADVAKLKEEAKQARAEGDDEKAALYDKLAAAAAIGVVMPVGGGAAARSAVKAGEKAAVRAVERELSPLGFYSHGAETAANLAQAKGTPDQMTAMLRKYGVKPEEMYATGFANESATAAARSKIEAEFAPKIAEAQRAMEELDPASKEFKAAERQFKNISSTMRSEMDRALVLGDEWANRPSVTREELAQHFNERRPQIEETVLRGPGKPEMDDAAKQEWINNNAAERAKEAGDIEHVRDWSDASPEIRDWHLDETTSNFNEQMVNNPDFASQFQKIGKDATKFSQYTLPGGENYREVLLKMPDESGALRKETAEAKSLRTQAVADYANAVPGSPEAVEAQDRIKKYTKIHTDLINNSTNLPPEFRSSHWDDPNVLAHIRMADRTGPNGEKILHVEEIQSDWGQKGKKEGFKIPLTPELENSANAIIENKLQPGAEFMNPSWRTKEGKVDPRAVTPSYVEFLEKNGTISLDEAKTLQSWNKARGFDASGIPTAPYVTNTQAWTDLALKRALKEAAEGGYDKLVWTPGAEQAKRYRISNQVNSIDYMRKGEDAYKLGITNKQGEGIDLPKDTFTAKELEDYLGKEVAQKIIADEGKAYRGRNHKTLEGLDLEVGGSGMKGYYDKIVPTQLSKLVKKLDPEAKIGMENISVARKSSKEFIPSGPKMENAPQSYDFHSLTITPKMREAIMKGQTEFAEGGKVETRKPSVGHPSAHIALVGDIRETAKEHGLQKPALTHLIKMMGIPTEKAAVYARNILEDNQLHHKVNPATEKFLITLHGAMKQTAVKKHTGELRRHLRDRVIYGNP